LSLSPPRGFHEHPGGQVRLRDDLVEEVTAKAFEEVTVRRPELPEEERRAIAESVAIAAIRYDIVRVSPEKSTVFDWKEALNFERQSGPYIQYAHARACSILEKAGEFERAYHYETEHEVALVRHLAKFPSSSSRPWRNSARTTSPLSPRARRPLQRLLPLRPGAEE